MKPQQPPRCTGTGTSLRDGLYPWCQCCPGHRRSRIHSLPLLEWGVYAYFIFSFVLQLRISYFILPEDFIEGVGGTPCVSRIPEPDKILKRARRKKFALRAVFEQELLLYLYCCYWWGDPKGFAQSRSEAVCGRICRLDKAYMQRKNHNVWYLVHYKLLEDLRMCIRLSEVG